MLRVFRRRTRGSRRRAASSTRGLAGVRGGGAGAEASPPLHRTLNHSVNVNVRKREIAATCPEMSSVGELFICVKGNLLLLSLRFWRYPPHPRPLRVLRTLLTYHAVGASSPRLQGALALLLAARSAVRKWKRQDARAAQLVVQLARRAPDVTILSPEARGRRGGKPRPGACYETAGAHLAPQRCFPAFLCRGCLTVRHPLPLAGRADGHRGRV